MTCRGELGSKIGMEKVVNDDENLRNVLSRRATGSEIDQQPLRPAHGQRRNQLKHTTHFEMLPARMPGDFQIRRAPNGPIAK